MQFQEKIQCYRFMHSCNKQKHWKPSNYISSNKRSIDMNLLQEVPTIEFLRQQVQICTDGLSITQKPKLAQSWNSMFHEICKLCDLEHEFPPWVMPSCYTKKKTCSHILKVNLDKATTNTLYLSVLDNMSDTNSYQLPISVAALFIQSVVYENPPVQGGLIHFKIYMSMWHTI